MAVTGADLEPLAPHENALRLTTGLKRAQWAIYTCLARFRIVCTGRRFGKTTEIIHELVRAAQVGYRREVAYIAPSLKDAKRLMWLALKRAIPPHMIISKNESTLEIIIKGYESRIRLFGADRPDSIYGEGFDFVAIDEAQSMPGVVWEQYISPTLVDKQGEALICFRPEGMDWYYDLFIYAESPDNAEWEAFQFTTLDGENVAPEEIERERKRMSAHQFAQEYEANFQNPQGRVYPNFSRMHNVSSKEAVDLNGPILVSMDFNVDPFTMGFSSRAPDKLLTFDEMELWGGHTQMAVAEINLKFPGREILVYPDPSGRQRKTAAGGNTDFSILAQAGYRICAPPRTADVRDRINTLQALCADANGVRRWMVHPRCRRTIRSMDGLVYNKDDGKPNKKGGLDHFADGYGYLAMIEFPLARRSLGSRKLGGF